MAVFEFLFLKFNRESVFNDLVQLRGAFLETASENINSRRYTTIDFVYRGFSPQHIYTSRKWFSFLGLREYFNGNSHRSSAMYVKPVWKQLTVKNP